jgi:hypothetical protein
MLFLLAILAAASGTTPSVARLPEAPPPRQSCAPPTVISAQQTARSQGLRRLGEDPPASEYLAIERRVGGCQAPAIVRTGIGH